MSEKSSVEPLGHKLSKTVIKMLSKELIRLGIEEATIHTAIKNILPEVDKISSKIDMSCMRGEHSAIVSAAEKLAEETELQQSMEALRQDHVGRILIHEVSPAFPKWNDKELAEQILKEPVQDRLPRSIITGLTATFKDMFGQEFIDRQQRAMQEIVEIHRVNPDQVRWDKLFSYKGTRQVMSELLPHIKEFLDGRDDSSEWLRKRIGENDKFKKEMERELTHAEYQTIYRSLFRTILGFESEQKPSE